VSASFQYDGLGRRRAKTIASASTGFLYDGLNAVQELTSGTPSADIVAGLGLDEWLARADGGGTSYFLTDALGSTMALADGTGAVQTGYTYEPFGGFSTSGAGTSNPSAFTGREADGSGLSFYRARYYHPQLQRFVSEDPLGFGAGVNFFAYVGNSRSASSTHWGSSQAQASVLQPSEAQTGPSDQEVPPRDRHPRRHRRAGAHPMAPVALVDLLVPIVQRVTTAQAVKRAGTGSPGMTGLLDGRAFHFWSRIQRS
jgi:RHS repeat-associated protein